MKIGFVTDMHFGYRRFEQDAYNQGREAILSAARQSDLIILGGDNFDTPLPRMETLAQATGILREALAIMHARGAEGVPIFAIHGNHDRRPKGFVHPTELLARGGFLENAHNKTLIFEKGGQKVAVSGMGSVPEDLAVSAIQSLQCRPVQGAFNILVVHQTFQEYEKIPHDNYLSFEDLPKGFDLYLCGHVHQPNLKGQVLNPGSTVVTQLRHDEAGER
jgi:DNA repair exonuclease SbcCD nuclease subunit